MNVIPHIEFDDDDQKVFQRALEGHGRALVEPPRNQKETEYLPVRTLRNRILQHGERFDGPALEEIETMLMHLQILWAPMTQESWWRDLGAPGSDDAIAGLAAERRNAIRRVEDALELVRKAQEQIRVLERIAGSLETWSGLAQAAWPAAG